MPILFGCIAHNGKLIAQEPESADPALIQLCQSILARLPADFSGRKVFEGSPNNVHAKRSEPYTLLCVADPTALWRQCQGMLDAAAISLAKDKNNPKKAIKEAFILANDPKADNLGRLGQEIEEATDVMRENLAKVLARGEKLVDIEGKSQQLREDADDYHKRSRDLKRSMCRQHWKLTALLAAIILLVVVIIAVAIGLTSKKKK
eukprot:TRINITY_DN2249_c0_g1_i2.p1 TRINITY_DN2249_c0_g1~~TRINITY_DN2249_c0_g1_i2.p1  ORF type:complete len:205 (+),score=36.90 TRINITY_DN2249_c0_g1_i2:28-642(+)